MQFPPWEAMFRVCQAIMSPVSSVWKVCKSREYMSDAIVGKGLTMLLLEWRWCIVLITEAPGDESEMMWTLRPVSADRERAMSLIYLAYCLCHPVWLFALQYMTEYLAIRANHPRQNICLGLDHEARQTPSHRAAHGLPFQAHAAGSVAGSCLL
jgi:hypothetical protein